MRYIKSIINIKQISYKVKNPQNQIYIRLDIYELNTYKLKHKNLYI